MTLSVAITKDMTEKEVRRKIRNMMERVDPIQGLYAILEQLQAFEQKYGMSTLEFYVRFRSGQMGDAEAFIRWASLYEMYVDLVQQYPFHEKAAA